MCGLYWTALDCMNTCLSVEPVSIKEILSLLFMKECHLKDACDPASERPSPPGAASAAPAIDGRAVRPSQNWHAQYRLRCARHADRNRSRRDQVEQPERNVAVSCVPCDRCGRCWGRHRLFAQHGWPTASVAPTPWRWRLSNNVDVSATSCGVAAPQTSDVANATFAAKTTRCSGSDLATKLGDVRSARVL